MKLYIDILDNAYQPENIQLTNLRTLRPYRNFCSQFTVESRSIFTSTEQEEEESNNVLLKNLTILTPSKINEKSDAFVSFITEDGEVIKKRKLNRPRAGPRCKTRPHWNNIVFKQSPLTLLQCALKQINRNFNLLDDGTTSLESFPTTDGTIDTADSASMSQNDDDYSPSPEMSEMEYDDENSNPIVPDVNFEEMDFHLDIDLSEPAMCNYCIKRFSNIEELARHEIQHIKVDLSPRVDSKQFNMLHTKLAFYYTDYLRRQNILPPKEARVINKPVTRGLLRPNAPKPVLEAVLKPTEPEIQIKMETKQVFNKPVTRLKEKRINYGELAGLSPQEDEAPSTEDNSLLVPQESPIINSANCEFTIENDEIFVNGVLLRSMDKRTRRECFKSMIVNGVKRKFCPLCRHTFKDNWAIENHYMSGVCMYTCKFCARKFKYHKDLFHDHMKTHAGELPNKIFGPKDRQLKQLKKKRLLKQNRTVFVGHMINNLAPKSEALKMKQFEPLVQIKTEPDLHMNDGVTLEAPGSSHPATHNHNEPYQAYFCRKCFKVFFNVNEYNTHIRVCTGHSTGDKNNVSAIPRVTRERTDTRVSTPDSSGSSRRLLRAHMKNQTGPNDSDNDSRDALMNKLNLHKQITPEKSGDGGWDCGICCSSFPSRYSRNSHMRIHKIGDKSPIKLGPKDGVSIPGPGVAPGGPPGGPMVGPPGGAPGGPLGGIPGQPPAPDFRFVNLNPTVARLVQNNPHLTIRSYIKNEKQKGNAEQLLQQQQQQQNMNMQRQMEMPGVALENQMKRAYKCADCDEKFENKSILYYHKMNSCIVKRHYECAFCRKRFGTYDQYNTHMFYVHPE